MENEITPCPKCNCMTKSIRKSRANYYCGKCKADKSLSDVYFYEAMKGIREKELDEKDKIMFHNLKKSSGGKG